MADMHGALRTKYMADQPIGGVTSPFRGSVWFWPTLEQARGTGVSGMGLLRKFGLLRLRLTS